MLRLNEYMLQRLNEFSVDKPSIHEVKKDMEVVSAVSNLFEGT